MKPQTLKTILGHSIFALAIELYSHVLPATRAEASIQKPTCGHPNGMPQVGCLSAIFSPAHHRSIFYLAQSAPGFIEYI